MFKKKLILTPSNLLRISSKPTQTQSYNFRTNNSHQQQNKSNKAFFFTSSLALLSTILLLKSKFSSNQAEPNNSTQESEEEKPDQFEIPKLLLEREAQIKQEYQESQEANIKDIELSREEIKELQEFENIYSADKTIEEEEEEENLRIINPSLALHNSRLKQQNFRTIKIGPMDLLKNGQMIQVSVCDPFDDNVFNPTDKVIIAKHNDKYFALGSFCGFDFTSLAQGAFLGEKLICPTCGSTYNILNGFVDSGPSMRNISSFHINVREDQIQMIIPEHIPPFQRKRYIKRANIDPRTFVVLGDTETALAALDALRCNYTGKLIVVPSSPFGAFENQDILNKKFRQIHRNEIYLVEEDFLDRANVDVYKGEVSKIDLNKKLISVRGQGKPIPFDKVLIAWGSEKKKIQGKYSNVFYIEDRQSHAKVHNEIIKAKSIVILGGTFEAYQTAISIREYLDSVNNTEAQIVLMDPEQSEVQQCFGYSISKFIHSQMREKRISVIMQAKIKKLEGVSRLETIVFNKSQDEEKFYEKNMDYFLNPDVVICENGLGDPKYELKTMLTADPTSETGDPPLQIGMDQQGIPSSNIRFSLNYNNIHSPIFAAGSCTQFPSFIQKHKIRTQDVKYNIESGFYAAMNMMDKRVEFKYIPFTPLRIGDMNMYFIGERNQPFHEIIMNGDVDDKKFVAFYVYGDEVVGILTCGYQNLHLYLWEAMKLLIFPPASVLRTHQSDYKDIVKKVLQLRPIINCKRHDIVKIPSVLTAEKDGEMEELADLKYKIKSNIENENEVQRKRLEELKEKFDREGVEFIENESQMPDSRLQRTPKGGYKPRGKKENINMGADNDNQKNPITQFFNSVKKTFNG